MNQLQFIPQVKICPSRLVFFNSIEGLSRRDTFTIISKVISQRVSFPKMQRKEPYRTGMANSFFAVKNGLLS